MVGIGSWVSRPLTSIARVVQRSTLDPVTYLLRLVIMVLFALYFGLPVIWLFIAPTKTHKQLTDLPPLALGSLQNIVISWQRLAAYNRGVMFQWIWNSVWYVLVALTISLVISIPAGYLLANVNFKGRKVLLWLTLILMLLPADATVLPMYMELFLLKLVNTPWAVILPAGMAPFGVYLTYTYYKTIMHRDIIDAARVDGCSDLSMFFWIGLPLAQSVVAMLLFTQFSALWNNFFSAMIFLESDNLKTLPVGIQVVASITGALNPNPNGNYMFRPDLALLSLMNVLPVIIVFIFSQSLIIKAATSGAIQGE
jgi:multiple sugar transport system permease protein